MADDATDLCPVHASIQLLQEKWVLHIVRRLLDGPTGFNALSRAVGGVNATTLSHRLDRLERLGVVVKTVESTMPPRTRYELGPPGRDLQAVVDAIDAWGRAHMPACRAAEAAADGHNEADAADDTHAVG
ncbi:MAG: helix-turn-helix domain-containing protein [Trueperaceae bacterium]